MNCQSLRRIIFAVTACGFASSAFSQRGASYQDKAQPWDSASKGFPGYFDTNVANKDSIVCELPPVGYGLIAPSMAVDYGITESMTVGTNALLTTLPWLFGAQGASIKVRSLLYGTAEHQSAMTVYAGYLGAQGQLTANAVYENATWNHSWRPKQDHTITGHANYMRLDGSLGKSNDLKRIALSVTTYALGLGYGYDISPSMAIRGIANATVYSSIDISTPTVDISQTSNSKFYKKPNRIAQMQIEYHTQGDWLISLGIIHGYFSGTGGTSPWIAFAFRM